ncbi:MULTISPECIES: hypothetical protein [unclassified Kitasatospora]
MQVTAGKCVCGKSISGTVGTDGVSTWSCVCRRFGYLLPPDYALTHPDESRIQVCGRKRLTSVPAPVMA